MIIVVRVEQMTHFELDLMNMNINECINLESRKINNVFQEQIKSEHLHVTTRRMSKVMKGKRH